MAEVAIGRIAKAHGIGGELAIEVSTDSPRERFAPGAVVSARLRDKSRRALTVDSARAHGERLLVRFAEIEDRTAAENVRGALLLADTADLPPITDADEYYDHQLEGLAVRTVEGEPVGKVSEVLHGPAGELLAVAADGREILVPFVHQIVPTVDLTAGEIVIDPPDGLLDEE